MVRIRDVARFAGVSTATVSRVINGHPVRPDLAKAVHRAVGELGYVPHATARSLRRGHSDLIALIVPDVANPFFTSIARTVEDVAQQAGYSVVLCNTDDDPGKEKTYLDIAARENMAGVIIAPATSRPALEGLLAQGRAVVVIDREVEHDVEQITFDNERIGRKATRSLITRGHHRIICITGPRTTSTAVQRADGWRAELTKIGHPPAPGDVIYANFRVDGGRQAAQDLLNSGVLGRQVRAVLATNNLVGVGVLQALSWADHPAGGVDVGIIGDLPFATSDLRGVSITNLEPAHLARRAAQRFLEQVQARYPSLRP